MTYQILSQTLMAPSNSEPYVPTGTDEAEYDKWMAAIHGEEGLDDDLVQRDRAELFGG